MGEQIIEMNVLLEMVTSSVWNNARINYVNFPNAPAVKARLGKKVLEHPVVTDLDVTATYTQASNIASGWKSAAISVVKDPT